MHILRLQKVIMDINKDQFQISFTIISSPPPHIDAESYSACTTKIVSMMFNCWSLRGGCWGCLKPLH